jgi:hypothetical protein
MSRTPFRTKYEQSQAYKNAKYIDLRCLTDGGTRTFVLDGPHPDVPGWQTKTPQSGTSKCLAKFRQRMADPLGTAADDVIPVFVWDPKDGAKPPRVWDPRISMYVEPVVMNDHLRACMKALIENRNTIEAQSKAKQDAIRRESEERANAGMNALLGSLAERLGQQQAAAPAKPSKQPAPSGKEA